MAVTDAAAQAAVLEVGIAHPHVLVIVAAEAAEAAVGEVAMAVRVRAAEAVEVRALELVHLHALETVMGNAVIHAMVVQIIAKEIVVTPVLEDAKIHVPVHAR